MASWASFAVLATGTILAISAAVLARMAYKLYREAIRNNEEAQLHLHEAQRIHAKALADLDRVGNITARAQEWTA
jgi:hypothetical protein